ncbi:hypothetical protein [Paraflavitalea speifideaquila]|uniref:hypothetical protein n=1 Tax=Paraflavitalea speifideaquila TaxID=3076558 RepID=UPI0028EF3B36|nr:hypothetical protein [Paraflavitalea speifideiaquila]
MASYLLSQSVHAQKGNWSFVKNGSFYISWGYNTEWYTRSTVHIKQPSLGNDYKLVRVKGHDRPGWDDGLFSKPMTIPSTITALGTSSMKNRTWPWRSTSTIPNILLPMNRM